MIDMIHIDFSIPWTTIPFIVYVASLLYMAFNVIRKKSNEYYVVIFVSGLALSLGMVIGHFL